MTTRSKAKGEFLFGIAACLHEIKLPLVVLLLGLFGALPSNVVAQLISIAARALP